MEKQQLTQDEINDLSKLQLETQNLILKLGQLEYEFQTLDKIKKELIVEFGALKNKEQNLTLHLQQKYGDGNIDLKTGEITPLS
jgi:hypothetical protein